MTVATCLPLMGLPRAILEGLAFGLVGLVLDAAVGAAIVLSPAALDGEFQWTSLEVYTSWMT